MMDRRGFLESCSVLLGAGLLGQNVFAAPNREANLAWMAAARSKRIRIGTQTNTFGVPIKDYDRLMQVLDILHRIGYQGFETNYMSLDPLAGRAAECRKAFESHHVALLSPHTSGKLWDREKTPAELDNLRRIAKYSKEMGATHLILSGSKVPRLSGDKPDVNKFHIVNEGLNAVGRLCHEEGLRFCYHNHIQEFLDEPSQMSLLLKETDPKLVWINYDVGNAYPTGPNPAEFSKENFRRIAVYHIKDVEQNTAGKTVPTDLGAGKLDLKAVVAPLLDSDWSGWLVVEREENYPKAAEDPEALLKQCRDYLKQITSV